MPRIEEGRQAPDVTLRVREDGRWTELSTADLFRGRTVIVFGLPGAFTPTCSSQHVPRFDELAETFFAHGVDEIVCVSVNDAFVMEAWKEDQRAEHVRFLPDGNGEFTHQLGLLVDKSDLGFGQRSWRYSMLVRDGVIEKSFVEPQTPGDPYEVSDADTMLRYVAPDAEPPPDLLMFTRPGCPFCIDSRRRLREAGLRWSEIDVHDDVRKLRAVSTQHTTPQVFVNGRHLGDADALERWLAERA